MTVFLFILGVIAFLLIEHPIAFWLVFVPLVILFIITLSNFLTSRRGYIVNLLLMVLVFVIMIVSLVIVVTPKPCEHEDMVTMYSFSSYNSTAHSSVRPYCKDCEKAFRSSLFQGTLVDQSYLSAIEEHSDSSEIVPNGYYTVTATVPIGFTAYNSDKVTLNCRVENEDFIVSFSVEFQEEFEEMVRLVEKGDEITFRGRFYDEGCGFTDCELIEQRR